ncbi:uncharacterized protein LOC6556591 [Drosophila grimshawi]|uniref:uncharacterized protein LOC6556591 n=1 Tax=Drosophila grimshawi TaxID=7222 RepID=UPI000C871527|nr:uncharacterized protein LOC6556591 [Drosophila grimshawi]
MRQSIRIDILPVIIVILIVIGSASVGAVNIADCNDIADGEFIDNPQTQCAHSLIYCDGVNSMFCDRTDWCDADFTCDGQIASTTASSITSGRSTISTSISTSTNTTDTPLTTTISATTDVRSLCRHGVTQKYKYPGNCNYYYYCMDGFLIVEQCPIGYAFNEPNGTCSGRIADIPDCRQ